MAFDADGNWVEENLDYWESEMPTELDVLPVGERVEMGADTYATRNADGSITFQDPDGSVYTVNQNGTYTTQSEGKTWTYDPKQESFVDSAGRPINTSPSSGFVDKLLATVQKNPLAALGTAAGIYSSLTGGNQTRTGVYQGNIPKYQAVREQVNYTDPNRRPGEAGRQYFTDVQYAKAGDQASIDKAKAASAEQAAGILAGYTPRAAAEVNPYVGKMKRAWETPPAAAPAAAATQPAETFMTPEQKLASLQPVVTAADGGLMAMAKGQYLRGSTDGMADKLDTTIDDQQPAKISHGEFVIPADVVSHLGNGNSDAGAEKLYQMMARIRKARTGNPEQGKRINPDKFMPGGLASLHKYSSGGGVKGFDGTNGSTVTTDTSSSSGTTGTNPLGSTNAQGLAPWVGDYVTDMLGKGQALSNQPYQAYKGPLTAGASDLQKQAFAGISDIAQGGYTPTTYSGGIFDTTQAQKYMNPYIQAALDPQLKEMQRQSDIARLADASRLTSAGAYGGSRQAIMEAEGRRNLLEKQGAAIGQGYQTAYDKAMAQYNADQARRLEAERAGEASRQYSADYGLKSAREMADLGATQRAIEAEGIAADKAEFEKQLEYPYKAVQYQKDLLTGLPITATANTPNTTQIGEITNQLRGLLALYNTIAKTTGATG